MLWLLVIIQYSQHLLCQPNILILNPTTFLVISIFPTVAKNYLTQDEISQLERIVSAYLYIAELQAMRRIPMTMKDCEERLNGFLKLMDRDILQDAGKVSAEIAREHAESEFEKYRIIQDKLYESDFDRFVQLEHEVKEDK